MDLSLWMCARVCGNHKNITHTGGGGWVLGGGVGAKCVKRCADRLPRGQLRGCCLDFVAYRGLVLPFLKSQNGISSCFSAHQRTLCARTTRTFFWGPWVPSLSHLAQQWGP